MTRDLVRAGSPLTVLVVEDDVLIALDLQETVTSAGGTVVGTVRTGEQAVTAAKRLRPDLVLMDVHLAGTIDGADAAEAIAALPGATLIFVTANSDEALRHRATKIGAAVVSKPILGTDLIAAIRAACRLGGRAMPCAVAVQQLRSAPIPHRIDGPHGLLAEAMKAPIASAARGRTPWSGHEIIGEARRCRLEQRALIAQMRALRLQLRETRLASSVRRATIQAYRARNIRPRLAGPGFGLC